MSATEAWLLVTGILAGIGALLHLYPERARDGATRAAWQTVAIARALVAASIVALAVALAVSPL